MAKIALLLLNFGTPKAPTREGVRTYLKEVLSDLTFGFLPKWLSRLLIRFVIIPCRLRHSVQRYQEVWTERGSMLMVNSKRLSEALKERLFHSRVALAMRYGSPTVECACKELFLSPSDRLIVLPLFPINIFSLNVSCSSLDCSYISDYYLQPWFINPTAQLLCLANPHDYDHLVFSFHALPLNYTGSHIYTRKCYEMADAIALKAKVKHYSVCFQSRMGFGRWTEPEIATHLLDLLQQKKKHVLLMMPGFIVDCLETVGDFKKYRSDFISAGGAELRLVGALNDFQPWVDQLAQYIPK